MSAHVKPIPGIGSAVLESWQVMSHYRLGRVHTKYRNQKPNPYTPDLNVLTYWRYRVPVTEPFHAKKNLNYRLVGLVFFHLVLHAFRMHAHVTRNSNIQSPTAASQHVLKLRMHQSRTSKIKKESLGCGVPWRCHDRSCCTVVEAAYIQNAVTRNHSLRPRDETYWHAVIIVYQWWNLFTTKKA